MRGYSERLPAQVFRPSIVVGDERSGWTASFNVIYTPLRAYARGALPVVPARRSAPVDAVPVSYVARAILAWRRRRGPHLPPRRGARGRSVGELIGPVAICRPPLRVVPRRCTAAWCTRCCCAAPARRSATPGSGRRSSRTSPPRCAVRLRGHGGRAGATRGPGSAARGLLRAPARLRRRHELGTGAGRARSGARERRLARSLRGTGRSLTPPASLPAGSDRRRA